jgi:hypothetical protein
MFPLPGFAGRLALACGVALLASAATASTFFGWQVTDVQASDVLNVRAYPSGGSRIVVGLPERHAPEPHWALHWPEPRRDQREAALAAASSCAFALVRGSGGSAGHRRGSDWMGLRSLHQTALAMAGLFSRP